MYIHEPVVLEHNPDSQTMVWVASCKKCHMKTRPLYTKHDAQAAFEEATCPVKVGDMSEAKTIG